MPFEEYWCSYKWANSEVKAVVTQGFEPETPQLYGLNASTKNYCLSVLKLDYSSFYSSMSGVFYTGTRPVYFQVTNAQFYMDDWKPKLTSPCCDTSCEVRVASAQIHYWPTPAPQPAVTKIVDSDGFTYTSPSVYVAYYNISATNDCLGNLGKTIARTMIAYAPTDLKTQDGDMAHGNAWLPLNYADLYSNCSSNWYSGNSSRFLLDAQYDLQHCHPILQAPPKLGALDPAWANCFQSVGIYDPPLVLKAANALAPAPTKDANPANVVLPSPGSRAARPTPSPTPPASTPAPSVATGSTAPSAEPDHSQSGNDPISTDPNDEKNTVIAALKPFVNLALAKTSSTTDPIANKDSGVAAHRGTNDPQPYNGSNFTASKLAKDSGSQNLAISVPNDGHDPGVVDSQSAKQPADPSGSYSSVEQPNGPPPSTNDKPHTASFVHAATLAQAPSVTTVHGHSSQGHASQSGVVIVDDQSITAETPRTTTSSTHIALRTISNLVPNISTIRSIVPTANAAPFSSFTVSSETMTLSVAHLPAVGEAFADGDQSPTIGPTVVSLGSVALHVGKSTMPLGAESSHLPSVVTVAAIGTVVTVGGDGPSIGTSMVPNTSSSLTPTQGPGRFVLGGPHGGFTALSISSSSNRTTANNFTGPINSAAVFRGSAEVVTKLPGSGVLLMNAVFACLFMTVLPF